MVFKINRNSITFSFALSWSILRICQFDKTVDKTLFLIFLRKKANYLDTRPALKNFPGPYGDVDVDGIALAPPDNVRYLIWFYRIRLK